MGKNERGLSADAAIGWPVDPDDAALAQDNVLWFRANQGSIMGRHPDMYVAIARRRVLGARKTLEEINVLASRVGASVGPVLVIHGSSVRADDPRLHDPERSALVPAGIESVRPKLWTPPEDGEQKVLVSERELTFELSDLSLRSVSFDLHATLVLPTEDWNLRIYSAFKSVLAEAGMDGLLRELEETCGVKRAADYAAGVADRFYHRLDDLVQDDAVLQDPRNRWSLVNNYALVELAVGDARHIGAFFERIGCAGDPQRGAPRLIAMGREVHERISGSKADTWITISEQQAVAGYVRDRGLIMMILSNGSQDAVTECVNLHYPWIPDWHILTPAALGGAGKPSVANAGLLLFQAGCIILRDAIEGKSAPKRVVSSLPRRSKVKLRKAWKRAVEEAHRELLDGLAGAPTDALGRIHEALTVVCRKLGAHPRCIEDLLIAPNEHLHVGNSAYHDHLPVVGLGLPIKHRFYAPTELS